MESIVIFGLGVIAIVYWLIAKAKMVKLIENPKVSFLTVGAVWFLLTALWMPTQNPRPSLFTAVLVWLGGWVATMLFKSGVKENERQEPPQG